MVNSIESLIFLQLGYMFACGGKKAGRAMSWEEGYY
jgi:hypothetical protein